ncbi:MAG: 3-oxo-tetronate kinase [Rubripirellula sp.]
MSQATRGPLIGCIADDFTGATDLAGLLQRSGMRVVQCFGTPDDDQTVVGFDAVVIALKSRSIASGEASRMSCEVAKWLRSIGSQRLFFKYCSTFDSTAEGNIGPVAESLLDLLQIRQATFCPAFPENGRSVYQGHLFVGDRLLHESSLRDHPLNPMTDANLVRWLAAQSQREVGLLSVEQLSDPGSIQQTLDQLPPLVIIDAIDDSHLRRIAECVVDHPLVTGGSAIAGHLASVLARRGNFDPSQAARSDPFVEGLSAVVAGSCSSATQEQVRVYSETHPVLQLDILNGAEDQQALLEHAKRWVDAHLHERPLIASTTDPQSLQQIQSQVGIQRAAELTETILSELAAYLVEKGVRRLVVAGGETSGAVTQKLGVQAIRIGPEIAPGVPWTESIGTTRIALALKSGNFGSADFFAEAFAKLPSAC